MGRLPFAGLLAVAAVSAGLAALSRSTRDAGRLSHSGPAQGPARSVDEPPAQRRVRRPRWAPIRQAAARPAPVRSAMGRTHRGSTADGSGQGAVPTVLTYPRDPNPYQERLHEAVRAAGVGIDYLPERTPSAVLNLLLVPWEMRRARARGTAILHVHWLFRFGHPLVQQIPGGRRLLRGWFQVVLRTSQACGLQLVWTAHNALPHAPIFRDDDRERRRLCQACCAVIAHSDAVRDDLVARGWVSADKVAVIPHGRERIPESAPREQTRKALGAEPQQLVLGLLGRVEEYKGVQDFLAEVGRRAEAGRWPEHLRVHVAGTCRDRRLREHVEDLARSQPMTSLEFGFLPEPRMRAVLDAVDLVVLPFRRISTSGSALSALGAGRPVALLTDLLPDLPAEAVVRADGIPALIDELARLEPQELARCSSAALAWTDAWTWADAGSATAELYTRLAMAPQAPCGEFAPQAPACESLAQEPAGETSRSVSGHRPEASASPEESDRPGRRAREVPA